VDPIFLEITVVIVIATLLAIVFRFFKQPPILAYILTGILLGPVGLFHIESEEVLTTMGQFGITFLLFMLGLELKLKDLKSTGKTSLILGVGQIIFTSLIGIGISLVFGMSMIASLYIGFALTFSSTIIVVKLLSDKKDLNSLYGKLSIGLLLVQDFVAILALILLAGLSGNGAGGVSYLSFLEVIIKVVLLFIVVGYLSQYLVPKLVDKIANSSELLFLFSVAWAFGIAALISSPWVGFSIEIGGFLAGIALANSMEHLQIVARIRPLRDFFVTIFFVMLGMEMMFTNVHTILLPAVFLSIFVLIAKPIIVMSVLGFLGYRKRTSFFTGLIVGQVSEFSLILIFLGSRLGHLPQEIISLVTITGIITFVVSTYMIMHSNALYKRLKNYLSFFEFRHAKAEDTVLNQEFDDHTILIGANRTGQAILDAIKKSQSDIVVVDFDPDVISILQKKEIICLFGDIADSDIQEKVKLDRAKLIISTVADIHDNMLLIDSVKHRNKKIKIIVLAHTQKDAEYLYKAGAHYVVIPHLSSGIHIAEFIKENKLHTVTKS
jgi:Kef-type K+ transport system membrane component KefB